MKHHASTTRRQLFGSVGGAAVAAFFGAVTLRGGQLGADRGLDLLDDPASAIEPAVRMRLDDLLMFPVLRGPGLVVLDNFGGYSVSRGSCAHRGIDIFPTDDEVPRVLVCPGCYDIILEYCDISDILMNFSTPKKHHIRIWCFFLPRTACRRDTP